MAQIFINGNRSAGTINKNIYGQFAEHLGRCIYGGLANADGSPRADAVAALRELGVPVLRWPGGCFADTYHWKDGVGPKETRKTIVNTNWGGVTETIAIWPSCPLFFHAGSRPGKIKSGLRYLVKPPPVGDNLLSDFFRSSFYVFC